jgi:hypothetical protein
MDITPAVAADGPSEPDRVALLELEVDIRIFDLLLEAWDEREWKEGAVAGYLRLAYSAGYLDALREPRPGELCRRYGFPVPAQRPPEEA